MISTINGRKFDEQVARRIPRLVWKKGWFLVDTSTLNLEDRASASLDSFKKKVKKLEVGRDYLFVPDFYDPSGYRKIYGEKWKDVYFGRFFQNTLLVPTLSFREPTLFNAVHPELFREVLKRGEWAGFWDNEDYFFYRLMIDSKDVKLSFLTTTEKYSVLHGYMRNQDNQQELVHLMAGYDYLNKVFQTSLSDSVKSSSRKLKRQVPLN